MIATRKLDNTGSWAVNGTPLYIPDPGVQVEHTNVAGSDSGRTEDGVMHIDWVRRDVKKVHLHYSVLSASELNYMFNLMQGKEFTFTYKDRGEVKTMYGYTGECNYSFYTTALNEDLYRDISINVVEV